MADRDEATTRPRGRGADEDDAPDWYDGSTAEPRPWVTALRETETPSVREYLQTARAEGATARALALVAFAVGILVVVPAALTAGVLTLFLFPVIEQPLAVWAGLTVLVLCLLVGWLETR
jgi:hypothetical protein